MIGQKVFDDALSLPADVRVSLIEKLINSLNLPTQAEINRLWAAEAEGRIAQIDAGEVKLIPGEKVFSAIRKKYRR
ncbi:MAG: addiction module protein [Nitrospirae bacterium]|nr:addiction module protein [Nitrospirota bacterium]